MAGEQFGTLCQSCLRPLQAYKLALKFILIVLCLSVQSSMCQEEEDIFMPDDQRTSSLLRMVTDPDSGRVYVGGVNRLYQLSSNLRVEAVVETGPREDNPMCPPPLDECQCVGHNCKEFEKGLMNSVTKALVVDKRGRRLIACSNLYQVKLH